MALQDLSEKAQKLLHFNRIKFASVCVSDSRNVTPALALRTAQTASTHQLLSSLTSSTQACPSCACIWIPGWNVLTKVIRGSLTKPAEKNATRQLSSRARRRKDLRAKSRQQKLSEKLEAHGKTLHKSKWDGSFYKSKLMLKCLSCNTGTVTHDILEAEQTTAHGRRESPTGLDSPSSQAEGPKKKRNKSKKNNALSKLIAKKEERSKSSASGLSLADFLAK